MINVTDCHGTPFAHDGDNWHVDERGDLHVFRKGSTGNLATYAAGNWESVVRIEAAAVLTKSQRILTLSDEFDGFTSRYLNIDEDTGLPSTQLLLPHSDACEFGDPQTLTITIEPGDRLNTFRCSTCLQTLPLSDAGPGDSDGGTWCQDCAAEGRAGANRAERSS